MTHPELVKSLVKHGSDIIQEITVPKANLWHMATGVAGEAGEITDCIKKFVIYNKKLDRDNLIEELGDMEFYLEGIRQECDITREEVLRKNIEKLSERYKSLQYSDKAAQDREDKIPAEEN